MIYARLSLLLMLATALAPCANSADAIVINDAEPLAILSTRLWNDYGYLVTFEDAPVDPGRETVAVISARGRIEHSAVHKPITFHVPRGSSGMPGPKLTEGTGNDPPYTTNMIIYTITQSSVTVSRGGVKDPAGPRSVHF